MTEWIVLGKANDVFHNGHVAISLDQRGMIDKKQTRGQITNTRRKLARKKCGLGILDTRPK